MKVVIAPDKFAGTLSAVEASKAIAAGWKAERPDDRLDLRPMADGGEGTIAAVQASVHAANRHDMDVYDARGRVQRASWLALPGQRALIEVAQACGLTRLSPADRNPRLTTSYGIGQLLNAIAEQRVRQIVVGLGGTATVDGGAGMAQALGYKLLRSNGTAVSPGAQFLPDIAKVAGHRNPLPAVIGAADVRNPLCGAEGSAAIFAKQKGAVPEDISFHESALQHMANVVERDLKGGPWREVPGAGAGGGLGFGLAAFCDASLTGGAQAVSDLIGLEAAIADADAVITGEGKIDDQTSFGKAPAFVAECARAKGIPVFAIAGQMEDGAKVEFDAISTLGPKGMTHPRSRTRACSTQLARSVTF